MSVNHLPCTVQYTDIIKTMPQQFFTDIPGGFKEWEKHIFEMNECDDRYCFFNLSGQPKYDILYFYLLTGGKIIWRANIIGYEGARAYRCWDGNVRTGRCWVQIAAPVVRPPHPIEMKGFQGFRYTESLW